MKMFGKLLKIRIQSLFSPTTANKKKQSGVGKAVLFSILFLYIAAVGLGMFTLLFHELCAPMHEAGLDWFYFAIAGVVGFMLSFVGSVFAAQTQLFDAKDNELLLAMPIAPGKVLLSRMVLIYAINFVFTALVMLPAVFVYGAAFGLLATQIIAFILCLIALPLLAMTFSCIIGWLIALLTSRIANKNTVSAIFMLIFMAVYFMLYANMNGYIQELLLRGEEIAAVISGSVFPVYCFGAAIAGGDMLNLLYFLLCSIIPFVIAYVVISKSFIKIATANRGMKLSKYKQRELRVSGQKDALLKKELSHIFGNLMYILNAAFGAVIAVVGAVLLVLKADAILPVFTQMGINPLLLGTLFLCFLVSINQVSAPSISIEGKTLWISQSLPIKPSDILMAKVAAHSVICMPPMFIASVIVSAVLSKSPADIAAVAILILLFTGFIAELGVAINLLLPKFNWINETVAVKQGASTLVSMLIAMFVMGVFVVGYIFFGNMLELCTYILICSMLLAVGIIGLYRYLVTCGAKRFELLHA